METADRLSHLSPERRRLLQKALRERAAAKLAPQAILRRAGEGPLPLSFAQQRLWFIDQLDPGAAAYNMRFPLRLRGDLDARVLRRALSEVVRRHEVLRTVFATRGEEPVQTVRPAGPVPFPVVDLAGLAAERAGAEAARLADEEALRPFDLARGPLLRATLLRMGGDDHAALFTMHHVVSDGWSMGVLVRELTALYGAFLRGEPSPLPELPVQYADFALWQREQLAGEALEEQLAWWRERLAGAPPTLDLPTDRPRRAAGEAPARTAHVELAPDVSRALRDLAQAEGATPFMALLAAFALLLSRYAGQDDVVVGSPVAGRTRTELEGLIGFFVNTLVLRTGVDGDAGFRALLGRVREATLGAFQHQDVPFERLVEELQPERSLAHTPFFQAMFALQNMEQSALRLGGLRLEPMFPGEGVTQFDLDFSLSEAPDRFGGTLRYRADLFDAATVERMAEHFRLLLGGALEAPDRPLSALSMLAAEERAQVVERWNRTARGFPRGRCLHELVAERAAAAPDAPAVVFEGRAVSYAELDAASARLAHALRRRGVGPEVRVGISVEKGPEMALAVLAVLRAGGAYVPLDPAYPAGRIAYMLGDSGAVLLLTQGRLADRFADAAVPVLAVESLADEAADAPAGAPESGVGPENLAYVIYTSGSTGTPKGVAVHHRAVVNLVTDMAQRLGIRGDDRLLQFASLSFDVSVEEIFTAWAAGAAIVLSRAELFAPGALLDTIEREGVTTFELPTAFWHEWVRELAEGGRRVPESVRFVRVGGERISPERLRDWAELRVPLVHVFGLTETACTSATLPLEAGDDGSRWANLPIGRPTGNARLYVLDRAGEPAPVGVPGELFIGGEGVARGYLGRAALTAERFVPDPFRGEAGARLYRTGDRVRWLTDGTMEFLGRIDLQVKVRGFRIEVGEIEAALHAHPGVREAVVALREDAPGDRRLVAYVTADGEAPTAAELRAHLRAQLPEHFVPSAFVALEALPLSPNGKLDRRALPAPEGRAEREYVAPRGEAERVLADAWAAVLGVDRVGVEDNFFELGGHSLLATRLVSRVREAFGVELPLRALFEAPTVAGLAERVEALLAADGAAETAPIPRVDRGQPLPLSFAQQRLWFIDQLNPASAAYNIPTALRLRGTLDAAVMRRALGALVDRHEVLRTVFGVHQGEAVQVLLPAAPVPLPLVDLTALAADRREELARRLAGTEAMRPFDLARGPMLRAVLLRLGDDDHAALFTMHHVASDAWSMEVLVREVSALYAALARGEEPALAPLPVQYADFAAWQREWLSGERLDAQLRYWRDQLAGAPPLLDLPLDHPRRPVAGGPAGRQVFVLGPEAAARLRELARRTGTTPFMALLAAWQLLLARWSGEEDVAVGSPIAGRTRSEVEGLIGFFVNTLVLRTDIGGDPDFHALLGRVRETTLGAFAHQDVPFERLVEELQPERTLTHTPFFQVMFALENVGQAPALALGALRMEPFPTGEGAAQFDLDFALQEGPDRVVGALRYRADLFEAATAGRMLRHFERIVEGVLEAPDLPVSTVSLLDDAERTQVLEAWNATVRDFPRDRPLHELVAARASETPDAPAVVFEGRTLSFAELDGAASRLAHGLRRRGVGPETRVGIAVEKGPEVALGIMGVLKAGGAYVPLDPAYPAERAAYVLRDSGAALLLTQPHLADRFDSAGVPVVAVESLGGEAADGPAGAPETSVGPDNLAYVIYTSGSTGTPKGVAVQHRAVVNYAADMAERVGLRADDRVLQFASLGFDVVVEELFPTWLAGAAVVFSREELFAPDALLRVVARERVTAFELPTAYWHEWVRELAERRRRLPECVRFVLVGGERVSAERLRDWAELRVPLVHVFGLTETACTSSTLRLEPGDDGSRWANLPVGRPTGNARLYVLDRAGQPAPVGVPGELFIGGEGVARGYLGRAALTAERFVPDPFGGEAGARLYRTGDRVRWLVDGELEFLGRIDQQVKVRGFRIEPGEVEAALERHPGVREAVVLVREDAPGDRRLVAYFTADGEPPAAAELRAHLAAGLPDYMVPSAFVALDALPLTAHGKLDRRALPAPEGGSGREYAAPRSDAERVLADAWAEVLRVDRVGVEDNFFELGGHSLLATRLVSRVREAFGVELPLRALFEAPTVAGLARRVEALLREGAAAHAPPLLPAPRDAEVPLSFAQQRLWFIDQLLPGSAAYNVPTALRLRGRLDVPALRASLDALARRHESLRTRFPVVDGEPVQRIAPPARVPLPLSDLRPLPEAEREAEARRLAAAESVRAFDLARGPLLRAALLRLGDEDHAALFTLHHAVSDAWSMEVLVREVSAFYAAFTRGEEPQLAPLPVQYADFAAWQRGWLQGEALEAQLGWWREQLAGAPPVLELPVDHPRRPAESAPAASRVLDLPGETVRAVRELARREGATPFMALLAAWQLLLARWSGQDDVSVGTPVAGRDRTELEGLIGFFLNTLVLRTDLSGDPGFRELLGRVRETTLGAFAHQDLPFERLVEELQPERSLTHTPFFQVMFTLENLEGQQALDLGDLRMEPLPTGEGVSQFDLSFSLFEGPDRIGGALRYRTDLFEAATADRLLRHFARLLEAAVRDPERSVAALPLLDGWERSQVVEEWNDTARDYPRAALHELVERQVERTPDTVALVFEGATLTYRELDRRADRLADLLRARGVGPEARVGVCMERSPELVISLLAVLKAGGAYVPLDPGYPAERLAYTVADAAPAVVLAQEHLRDRLAGHTAPVLFIDVGSVRDEEHDTTEMDGQQGDAPPPERGRVAAPRPPGGGALGATLAYVIYTSGSTGRPKGAMNTHAAIVNRLLWMQDEYGLGAGDAVLQKTPFGFDVSVWEFFWPLIAGARLVVAKPEGHRDPAYLAELIRRERVTTLHFVPPMLAAFLEAGEAARCGSLRRVVCSGEALPFELQERFFAAMPGVELHNLYGPTEAAVDVTYWACRPGRPVPIGAPVANTRILVLDRRMEPTPPGVPGELHIAGVQVGRGYLARPELTAEKFVPDPFSPEPSARMYRTGDLARWRADGQVEYLGRIDQQVKVRGFRIEPGEIEAALLAHPAVRRAVVIVREDVPGDRRLAAYFTAEGEAPAAAELRAHLAARLPEYMVPSAFVALETIPLTPNGKLDRRALPAPEGGSGREYVAPRSETERVLAEAWGEVLRVERVGVHDSFFELGGHSLIATRVVSRVREAFGVELPLRALFEAPTVAGLAERVDAARGGADAGAGSPEGGTIPRVPRTEGRPLPLSFAQQRLWLLDQLEPGSAAYNMPFRLRLRGRLDAGALRWALSGVVRRHEALRTRFPAVDGEPVQQVDPAGPVRLAAVALDGIAEERRAAELARLAAEEAARPFDLARGPLLRVTLARLGAEEHALLLTLHHVVTDGWSMEVLVREVFELYAARVAGREPVLPELPVQYADFAAWQREWLAGERLEAQLGWWRERLAGAPPVLELPTDRPRPPVRSGRGAVTALHLEPAVAEPVQALARAEGATLFMVLLSAFSALLARYSGQTDVVVGTPIAGRGRRETEGLIGFFLNTLALRTDLAGDPGFRELLGRVRDTTLGAYAHQDVPFERVLEEVQPERSLSHSPVFQVMLNLQNFGAGGEVGGVPGLTLEPLPGGGEEAARYDLTLYAQEGPDGIHLHLVYDTDLFEAERMAELLGHLRTLLEGVGRDPGLRLSALPLLTAAEQEIRSTRARGVRADRPLPEWAPEEAEGTIIGRFERIARLHPERPAVRTRTTALTYAELDRAAERAAAAVLRARPAAGERVALLFEHDAAMIVGILAALKAGKTYVPIDPLYPRERSAYVLEDSGAAALLTNAANLELARELAGGRVPLVDVDAAAGAGEAPARTAVESGTPAYILYTSGSTGRPKGVAQSHRNVLHHIRAYGANLRIGPDDVMTLFSSYTFDAAVMAIYGALLNGATLCPFSWREEAAAGVAAWIRREGITLYHSTPTVFRHLAADLAPDERFPGVRLVVLGGEETQRRDVEAFNRHFAPGSTLVNGLGPTESTVTLQHFVEHGAEPPRGSVPVGHPVERTEVLLMNAAGEQPAVYGAGEIVIRGPHVAPGYWNRPEQTAAAFTEEGGGVRAYRTGDLGRRLPDGGIEFLGRGDFQLKIRGHRVEPGEVEAALRAFPGVREAVAAPWEDDAGERRLAAYLVPEEGAAAGSAAELVEWLRGRLPDYMIPSGFVVLESLPLTPNGKVDRLALPKPEAPASADYVEPGGWMEEALAGIWAEVLGVERVGARDNFFALGGHSLLATRLVSAVRDALGVELPLRAVFENPTVAGLAGVVEALSLEMGGGGELSEEELRALEEMSEEEAMRLLRGE